LEWVKQGRAAAPGLFYVVRSDRTKEQFGKFGLRNPQRKWRLFSPQVKRRHPTASFRNLLRLVVVAKPL
jgi:hypothetical protein